jgi:hypothetical protein
MMDSGSQTRRGHEEPFAVQFSIFLANRVGRLRDLLGILAEEGIALYGFCIVDSSEWAVVRAICSDPSEVRQLLKAHGAGFTEKEVILIELPDDGAMALICTLLIRAELNINFAYPLLIRRHLNPVMVLRVDEQSLAVQLLTRHGFTLLGAEDLADPI